MELAEARGPPQSSVAAALTEGLHDIYTKGRFFVSTQNSGSVDRLFSRHNKEYEVGMSPMAPDLEVRLRGSFEKLFRNYKAA